MNPQLSLGLEGAELDPMSSMGSLGISIDAIVRELPEIQVDGTTGESSTGEATTQIKTEPVEGERRVLLVAAASRAKQVAGSIAQTIRASGPPMLSAVGPGSVNQAVKAIAIARTYLEQDEIDLTCEITHKPGEKIKDLMQFTLSQHPLIAEEPKIYEDLKSSAKSKRGALAGAIANNIRENKLPRVIAVGKGPVFQAVTSIVTARKYLVQDNLDLRVVPEFTEVTFENGTTANAMTFMIHPQPLE